MKSEKLMSHMWYLILVTALVINAFFLCGIFSHKKETTAPILEKMMGYSDRFVPSGSELLRGMDCKCSVVTDCFTGSEYLVIEGCGIVKLEAPQEIDTEEENDDGN